MRARNRNARNVIGAIIGDIAGSVYEFDNYRGKDFVMFDDYDGGRCFATDDSIMTLAVAKALLDAGEDGEGLAELTAYNMRKVGRPYPHCGYGGRFYDWMYDDSMGPYNSFGNGSAMRVSPVAYFARSLTQAEEFAEQTAAVTHNHPEGIKGAKVTAGLVYLALNGLNKNALRAYAEESYDLNFTLDEIRPTYRFNETCMETVPQAIVAFLESKDFEDAIRNAISIGGDSDTLAAITGGIAGAFYGVPAELHDKATTFLDERLLGILRAVERSYSAI